MREEERDKKGSRGTVHLIDPAGEPIINIPAAIKAARISCRVALPSKIERPLFVHRHKYRILSALHRGNDNRIPPSDSLFLSACYMMHLPRGIWRILLGRTFLPEESAASPHHCRAYVAKRIHGAVFFVGWIAGFPVVALLLHVINQIFLFSF